jgi:hypothetical protein
MTDNAALRSEMRIAARREYETKYMAEQNYALLLHIYQRALAMSQLRRGRTAG